MVNLAEAGMTMVVVTHEMGFAKKVADEIIFMDNGKIIEKGDLQAFFRNPQTLRAQQFLSRILI
jgi:ABC-type polar amino acid transport system ATPase subunit